MKPPLKLLSIALMLAMLLGIMPCVSPPAYAADATSWTQTDSLPGSGGSYKLTGNVTIASTWEVNQDITLDLNGYGILCTNNNSVIKISGKLTLTDSDPDSCHYITLDEKGCGTAVSDSAPSGVDGVDYIAVTGGYITGGKTNNTVGGGVYVYGGNFTLTGGTIVGNDAIGSFGDGVHIVGGGGFTMTGGTIAGSARSNGCGVDVKEGSNFTMTGGTITGNNAGENYGGGVSLSGATFTMEGGTITRNIARNGGGVIVYPESTFIMKGGTIENNETSATDGGAGVYVNGGREGSYSRFTMESGTITGNSASGRGGGVYTNGTGAVFTMQGGTISGNNAGGNGGGVYCNNNSRFDMQGGTISGNNAGGNAGGVYCNNSSSFNMQGGTISGNNAGGNGGGVYVGSTFTMQGAVIIDSNVNGGTKNGGVYTGGTANDVYLPSEKAIMVNGSVGETASIGVMMASTASGSTIAMGSGYELTADDAEKFRLENGAPYLTRFDGGRLSIGQNKLLTDQMVEDIPAQTYTGIECRPALTVTDDSTTLRQGTDFTVAWSENVNAGTATATLTGSGDYSGTVQKTFTIEKAPVTVTAADKSKISGQADPAFTATVTGKPQNGQEVLYTLSREEGETAGEYAITVNVDEQENPNYDVTAVNGRLTVIAATYTLSVTAPVFEEVKDDYIQPAAQMLTITNSGNSSATIQSVTVSGSAFTIAGGGDKTVAANGGTNWSYTVQPNAGLAAGTYTETVTVTYNGGATAAAQVSFQVTERETTAAPEFSLAQGSYIGAQTLTISCPTDGAKIYFTTDGADPTEESPVCSSTEITLCEDETKTVKAFAVKEGMKPSAVVSAMYTIVRPTYELRITAPTFDPVDPDYTQPDFEAITIENTGNSDVTIISVALYGEDSFELDYSGGTIVKAGQTDSTTYQIRPEAGLTSSCLNTIEVTYLGKNNVQYFSTDQILFTIREPASSPKITLGNGTYLGEQSVTITAGEEGDTIYYTTDDSDPATSATRAAYTGPIIVDRSLTLKACECGQDTLPSEVVQQTYTILPLSGNCGAAGMESAVTWELAKNGSDDTYSLAITGTGAMADYDDSGSLTPWSADGYPYDKITTVTVAQGVTAIGANAFNSCGNLVSVTFADNSRLTTIGDHAFYATGLTSVAIPDAVTAIGTSAFDRCGNLASVTFADNSRLTTIGDHAFYATGLTSVAIPDAVTAIGVRAFDSCVDLASVTFTDNSRLTTIGGSAFFNTKITAFKIPAHVTGDTESAYTVFKGCLNLSQITVAAGNEYYKSVDGVLYSKDGTKLLVYPAAKKETIYTVPPEVTWISHNAFENTKLERIQFSASQANRVKYVWFGDCLFGDDYTGDCVYVAPDRMIIENVFVSETPVQNCTNEICFIPETAWATLQARVNQGGTVTLDRDYDYTTDSFYTFEEYPILDQDGHYVYDENGDIVKAPTLNGVLNIPGGTVLDLNDHTLHATILRLSSQDEGSAGNLTIKNGTLISSIDGSETFEEQGPSVLTLENVTASLLHCYSIDFYSSLSWYGSVALTSSTVSVDDAMNLWIPPTSGPMLTMDARSSLSIEACDELFDDDTLEGFDPFMFVFCNIESGTPIDTDMLAMSYQERLGDFLPYGYRFVADRDEIDEVINALLHLVDGEGNFVQTAKFSLPDFGTPDFTLPPAVQTVEANAFEGADMQILYIPDTCTSVGDFAFKDCGSLTQARIPEGCALGTDVFDGCARVYVFGRANSPAETYCRTHENCVFVEEAMG